MSGTIFVNQPGNEREPSRSDLICLHAITVADYIRRKPVQTMFLHTFQGFKRVRYITADYDCVTGVTDDYLDQQTFAVHGDMPLFGAEHLLRAGLIKQVPRY